MRGCGFEGIMYIYDVKYFHRALWSGPYPGKPLLHLTVIIALNILGSIHSHSPSMDPFRAHLVALLSIYELGPFPGTPIPRYEGPSDWQTESILKSFGELARRMCSAEETVIDLRKQLVIICHLHTLR
jgi:hypothetical protein